VASFTTVTIIHGGFEMRCLLEIVLVQILMTGFAGIAAHIFRRLKVLGRGCLFLAIAERSGTDQEQH
jgi:hypothetical protein